MFIAVPVERLPRLSPKLIRRGFALQRQSRLRPGKKRFTRYPYIGVCVLVRVRGGKMRVKNAYDTRGVWLSRIRGFS